MEMRRFLSDFVGFGPVTDQSRESSQQDQVFSYLPRRHAACDMLINKNEFGNVKKIFRFDHVPWHISYVT